jgi:hypothetical protein
MGKARDPKCAGNHLALLARAWTDLEDRKRILRMKPLPKAIDVSPAKTAARVPEPL